MELFSLLKQSSVGRTAQQHLAAQSSSKTQPVLWCPDTVTQHLAALWQHVIDLAGLMLGSLYSAGQPELQGSSQVSEAHGTEPSAVPCAGLLFP